MGKLIVLSSYSMHRPQRYTSESCQNLHIGGKERRSLCKHVLLLTCEAESRDCIADNPIKPSVTGFLV
ncbi:hypothetical protein B296_00056174 [Ensete ventricosum]|uniref:Uncharacterized protein n=1 Tax=Ensete ventricosum TaxID=4639 RepID=A0A426XWQ0_ENSVE|nr:hypothetical protein B296_00056174 [Ensete ventricosum]